MQTFVHAQNLSHYIDLLDTVTEPALRERVESLLIEEEKRLGSFAERLDQCDEFIRAARRRLEAQKDVLLRLAEDGHRSETAERLHENRKRTLQLLLQHRRLLEDGLNGPQL